MTPAEIIARTYDREDANQSGKMSTWDIYLPDPEWESERIGIAKVVIAILAVAGWAIVPIDPTTGMFASEKEAYDILMSKSLDRAVNWKVAFDAIYRAMVEAGRAV